ncbi:hypothetical protein ANACOL_04211 [Anaerotruncus colihominis DSM 17241]|uniref:Uncharacterized protein n=1 Tax=Anaerotruncus colihominis DSM 17241 TaxID=445972 RepID=B0PHB8_9FIRM|nr:hypothetical protein ANACOL_04211 [Anaerotruncus colihominis DSM 17241]
MPGRKIAGDAFLHPRPIPAAILRQEYSGPGHFTASRPLSAGPIHFCAYLPLY